MKTKIIPRTVVNQILTHAQSNPEQEVCGLIGSINDSATQIYPIKNIASDTTCLFRMDPKEQIDAMRKMRETGESLYAIYHSHPHSPAKPSATDLSEAAYPEALYIIVSLNTKGVLEMQGFRLENGNVENIRLTTNDEF